MGRTPLCHAMYIGSTSLFQQLLTAGANPNSETNNEKSLISYSIEFGAHTFLNMLLKVFFKIIVITLLIKQYIPDPRKWKLTNSICICVNIRDKKKAPQKREFNVKRLPL